MIPAKETFSESVTVCAGPSIALTKYWGKQPEGINRPATPSLGVTLGGFQSQATLTLTGTGHQVTLNGQTQAIERFQPFFAAAVPYIKEGRSLNAVCGNNFPTGAGLASSASGFAALAYAVAQLSAETLSSRDISALARVGSGSAARAVYGGFTQWPAGAEAAEPLYDADYWPELRLIACLVDSGPKAVSSRNAMERARLTSPYYQSWVEDAQALHNEALTALAAKDLEKLGDIARHSYLRMFGTMFSSSPPLLYWHATSVALIQHTERLRRQGMGVWETMDAGPQVKLLCLVSEVSTIVGSLNEHFPSLETVVTHVGTGPCLSDSTKD
ncbi:diphosphomevalonate decarboxylase [Planctomycetota bacterium]